MSTRFQPEDIERLARMCRLQIDDDERAALAGQLERVVAYVEQLQEVDVDGVAPMTHVVPSVASWRDDVVQPVLGRRAVAGSSGYADGVVRVPRVVE